MTKQLINQLITSRLYIDNNNNNNNKLDLYNKVFVKNPINLLKFIWKERCNFLKNRNNYSFSNAKVNVFLNYLCIYFGFEPHFFDFSE